MIRKAHGFALIDLLFCCGIIGVLAAIALPRLVLAEQAAGSAGAIAAMRAINSAELTYALTCGNGFYAPSLTALGTAPPGANVAFISPDLGSASSVQKGGYLIQLSGAAFAGSPGSCNGLTTGAAAQGFKAGADPVTPNNTRFFATNSRATIYEHTSTLYAGMPEVNQPPAGHPVN